MLNEALLRKYCEGFFGYGNPHGKYWFIGPEEAGGRCEEEVQERLKLWEQDFGGEPIIDGFEFDKKREHSRRPFHNTQTTWDRLIRVQLAAEGKVGIDDKIAAFKEKEWARRPAQGGDPSAQNCLLELLPLPCPNTSSWPYDEWTEPEHQDFQSRHRYKKRFVGIRRNRLHGLITEYKPAVVVFYGRSCRSHWSNIAGFRWRDVTPEPFLDKHQVSAQFRFSCGTLFVLTYHPSPYRSKLQSDDYDAYFEWVGEEIKTRLRRCSGS